ncbi:hypothetical protein HZH68_011646 [Vespula germanica]|uniref:HTH psq-type domain-containing protein n=1 Tax=Vespula germanica TaxID=30212 RepID=A0A834JN00_VESGE|nr:hypothetical protein HZH68_011646 [Vespula germanica]
MWQKCWNTNQSLVHNLRFRERGPLKSWRPETMAEAIFSVLKEGLSLSQAARQQHASLPSPISSTTPLIITTQSHSENEDEDDDDDDYDDDDDDDDYDDDDDDDDDDYDDEKKS